MEAVKRMLTIQGVMLEVRKKLIDAAGQLGRADHVNEEIEAAAEQLREEHDRLTEDLKELLLMVKNADVQGSLFDQLTAATPKPTAA